MPCPKARFYCWTLNNYSEDEVLSIRLLLLSPSVRYACFCREVAPSTGTRHLQGYIAFVSQKTRRQCVSQISPRVSVRACTGSEEENIVYCSKEVRDDNPLEEFGTRKRSSGKRTDLEDFKNAVKGGCHSLPILLEDFSEVCAKYPRFVESYIRLHLPLPVLPEYIPREWQEKLNAILATEPDRRTINFVIDESGDQGKSYFIEKYIADNPGKALVFSPGKSIDLKYAFYSCMCSPHVVFFDAPRSRQSCSENNQSKSLLPYDFLEELKNGRMMNMKYNSATFRFKVPHVVVMTNQQPDMDALSMDRYNLINI